MTDYNSKDGLRWSLIKLFTLAVVSSFLGAMSRGMNTEQASKYSIGATIGLTIVAVYAILQTAAVLVLISVGALAAMNGLRLLRERKTDDAPEPVAVE